MSCQNAMGNELLVHKISSKTVFVLMTFVLVCALVLVPVRTLIGSWYFSRAKIILDDASTEYRDTAGISEDTLPLYGDAVRTIEKAATLDPSQAKYRKTLADLYFRLGVWTDAMERLNGAPPGGALASAEAFKRAGNSLRLAIELEPANADYHFARGVLLRTLGDLGSADREYAAAVAVWPVNAALRYNVAMQYLLSGDRSRALEQARILAARDESYLTFGTARKAQVESMRNPWYVSRLGSSYLFKSFEIAWRASDRNIGTIQAMVPANPDAQEAVRLFFESKGIEE